MKVLVIDDHSMFREALALLIQARYPDTQVLHAGSQSHGLQMLSTHEGISLVLLDLNLPDSVGPTTLGLLRKAAPEARWIVVSADERPQTVQEVVELGASGFVPKTADTGVLGQALDVILGGGVFIPPEPLATWSLGLVSPLSPRQRDVLRLLVAGKSNKVICRDLGLSESTIKTHVAEVFRRLGVSTRTQAVMAVAQRGWL